LEPSFGLKASYGRIPDARASRYSQTTALGALCTTVADSARLLDVHGRAAPARSKLVAGTDRAVRRRDRVARRLRAAYRVVERSRFRRRRSGGRRHRARRVRGAGVGRITARRRPPDRVRGSDSYLGQDFRRRHVGAHPRWLLARSRRRARPACAPGFRRRSPRHAAEVAAVLHDRLAIEDAMADLFDSVDVLATR